jgi:CxxC-x17-CxxC domain-containing protein
MTYQDKTIVCADCGVEFVHSAADQERYAQRGFTNEPKRCRTCRGNRQSAGGRERGPKRRAEGAAPRGESRSPAGAANRKMYAAVCAECGQPTQVPFEPSGNRPVYCRECFRVRSGRG